MGRTRQSTRESVLDLMAMDDSTSDKGSYLYGDLVAEVEKKYEFSKSEDSHVFLGMSVTRISEHHCSLASLALIC